MQKGQEAGLVEGIDEAKSLEWRVWAWDRDFMRGWGWVEDRLELAGQRAWEPGWG